MPAVLFCSVACMYLHVFFLAPKHPRLKPYTFHKITQLSELKKIFNIFNQLQSRIVSVFSFQETIRIGLNRLKIV